ncbi:hypothetical protein [Pararobbsia alpina]|uniref:hypothetical protein n=1 Tax=Pararobbsia alpina TaxID=621374 RepID=UPI0039A6ABFA
MRTPTLLILIVAMSGATSLCFAQASQPVESSVFTHRAAVDDGPESGAINDNWKFITSPPAKPVAASAPPAGDSPRHGRGGGRGSGGRGMRGTSSASSDGSNGATTGANNGTNAGANNGTNAGPSPGPNGMPGNPPPDAPNGPPPGATGGPGAAPPFAASGSAGGGAQ